MEAMEALFRRIEQLTEIGVSLSIERDMDRLLENILLAAMGITHADGGTLYVPTVDMSHLHFAIVRNNSLGVALGGTTGAPITGKFHDLPLKLADGTPNNSMVAAYAANTGKTVNIPDAYAAQGFDFSGTRAFDKSTGYRSQSFLTVPMKNHEGDLIGVLQLINSRAGADQQVGPFSEADQRLAESLASQAAIALTNRDLLNQLENLFESFITLINMAIDEKSPYTGGHCQRVPELTMMLAQAVNQTSEGPLAQVNLTDKDLYELRIAALLHDCGKVTTPVHVVDKGRKLETLHDRIHLIDTRFEVVKRDARVRQWQAVANGVDRQQAQGDYDSFCAQADADRDFLRHSNVGGERMGDDDVERVRQIAARYQWCNPAGEMVSLLDADKLENLTIRAGTLTGKERQIINHHIEATNMMLERLPWPRNLRNVPEFAGGHHERMDGKGYPRGLTREQLSWQARMMGIADIFEALTANDRPYKKAMSLSQALSVMENFKNTNHIDPDLYDIFIKEKVYLQYAEKFLGPEQINH